ncbi:MAG TPA: T9SS type A sorting domain-containing protein, partial [Flavobacteriaceae bacterium]|nr:T9SS type A sorting domain-containing protein [Flavobacteriaceae bacterium]
ASTQDAYLNSLEMTVSSLDDNVFKVELPSVEFNKTMVITLHNMLGQKMVKNRVENVNGSYDYTLNLNGLTSGVYLIRLGTSDFGKVQRIIVK